MNLRRKAAETLDGVADASSTVRDAAAMQTIVVGVLCIGVIVATAIGLHALNVAYSRKNEHA
jgi:hypothetical protein